MQETREPGPRLRTRQAGGEASLVGGGIGGGVALGEPPGLSLVLPVGGHDLGAAGGSGGGQGAVHPACWVGGWGTHRPRPLLYVLMWSVQALGCTLVLPILKSRFPSWGVEGVNHEALSGPPTLGDCHQQVSSCSARTVDPSSPSLPSVLPAQTTQNLEAKYITPQTSLPPWQFSGELGHSLSGHP